MNTLQHSRIAWQGAWLALLLTILAAAARAEVLLGMTAQQTRLSFEVNGLDALGEGDQLAVELDGYDVTALLTRSGNQLQLDLPIVLAIGAHPLQVQVFYGSGDVATLLEARVVVAGGAEGAAQGTGDAVEEPAAAPAGATAAYTYSFSALLSNNYRLDEKEPSNYGDIPHYASNGGVSYRGQGAGRDWQWQAELDALYDNRSENNPTGYEWELPNYRLAASRGSGLGRQGLALGTYSVLREDLLFSAYQRRGAAVSLGDAAAGPLQLEVFGVQSEPVTDYRHRLGFPQQSSERSSGGVLTLSPLPQDPQLLQLSVAYVDGETRDSGTGWLSPDQQTRYGGDSWNLAVDSHLADNSLWLHAEHARARFDSDGLGVGQGARGDSGHDLKAQLNSGRWFPAGPFDQWSLTLQQRQVGLDFFTLGNLSLPGDLQVQRANWQGTLGNLQLEAELARERNNLDDRDEVADQTTHRRLLNLYYYPMVDAEALPWRLLGVPSLNAGVTETRRRQAGEDAQLVGFDLNDRTRERLVGINFFHNRWNWSVQHTRQDTDDRSRAVEQGGFLVYQPPSDQRNRFTTLQVGIMPLDSLSLSTSWQWNKLQETDSDNVSHSLSRGLDLAWQIVPQRWRLNGAYYRGRDSSRFGDSDFLGDDQLQQTASLQLTWSASQAKGLRPGLDWFLKSSYARQESDLMNTVLEDWQLLLGFDLRWDTHTN